MLQNAEKLPELWEILSKERYPGHRAGPKVIGLKTTELNSSIESTEKEYMEAILEEVEKAEFTTDVSRVVEVLSRASRIVYHHITCVDHEILCVHYRDAEETKAIGIAGIDYVHETAQHPS